MTLKKHDMKDAFHVMLLIALLERSANVTNSITPLIQQYTVDFASNNNFLFVKGIQGDGYGTRYVDISLLNDTQPYIINPDAVEIVIRGTKPDNKEIFNACEIINSNTIRAEITQQMSAVAGKGNYEISIIAKEENRTLTSFPFFIMISKSSFDVGYVISSDEFGLLIDKINQVNILKTDITKIIEDTLELNEESRLQTEDCRNATTEAIEATSSLKEFHDTAEEAENQRIENEKKRQVDTATAIQNTEKATQDAIDQINIMNDLEDSVRESESERVNAENNRIQQAIDFANAEETRKANELIRIDHYNDSVVAEEQRKKDEIIRQNQEAKRQEDTNEALSESITATNNANAASSYAKSVGDDLVARLNRGEFKGEKGNDGIIHTISGQYAFQIIDDDLHMFYTEGDQPLDLEIDENGDLILNITE